MKMPPPARKDHWQGLFAELIFPNHVPSGHWLIDLVFRGWDELHMSTPGWVTPDTFPFEGCYMETCLNIQV